jgi:DNA-binding transcriptional LysR family regulator
MDFIDRFAYAERSSLKASAPVLQNLAGMDLNLLVVLRALLEERSVTRGAARVGLTQSATSHALARLRRLFEDPLLVRVGKEMRPTPKARALHQPLVELLDRIGALVETSREPRPEAIDRTFRILASAVAQLVIVPELLRRVTAEAPRARLEVHDLSPAHAALEAVTREVDLAICFTSDLELPATLAAEPLFTDRHVCLVDRDLPVPERLGWAEYARLGHVVCLPRGSDYPLTRALDQQLEKRGLARLRRLTVSGGLLLPAVLAGSELVATVSEREAEFLCRWFPLRKVEPPFRDTALIESMVWDTRFGADAAHGWLRAVLRAVAAAAGAPARAGSRARGAS